MFGDNPADDGLAVWLSDLLLHPLAQLVVGPLRLTWIDPVGAMLLASLVLYEVVDFAIGATHEDHLNRQGLHKKPVHRLRKDLDIGLANHAREESSIPMRHDIERPNL